jgi:hypothetical protein
VGPPAGCVSPGQWLVRMQPHPWVLLPRPTELGEVRLEHPGHRMDRMVQDHSVADRTDRQTSVVREAS